MNIKKTPYLFYLWAVLWALPRHLSEDTVFSFESSLCSFTQATAGFLRAADSETYYSDSGSKQTGESSVGMATQQAETNSDLW